jgi:uncharacterized membrane protein YebE (DUF533 family)
MDAQQLLDQLLESGKKLAQQGIEGSGDLLEKGKGLAAQGIEYAEGQLPPPGPERDALMKKVGVGAAASGILALLVGTKSGRKAIAPIVKVGSVAALGGLAYKMYTEWQKSQGSQPKATDVSQLEGEAANERSLNLIRAMIAAAKADGAIDTDENKLITQQLDESELNGTASSFLMNEMQQPADPKRIADGIGSNEEAVEVYLASLMVTGAQSETERNYLAELSKALKLEPIFARQLEREVLPKTS